MLPIWIVTGILSSLNVSEAQSLWHWFGHHVILTILMLIFLG